MVKIAYNQKPKNRTRTVETRAEVDKLLCDMITDIQKRLIGYSCLSAAVKESKCNASIAKRTEELITLEIERISKGDE